MRHRADVAVKVFDNIAFGRLKIVRLVGLTAPATLRVVVAALPQFLSLLPQEGGVVGGRRTGASVLFQ